MNKTHKRVINHLHCLCFKHQEVIKKIGKTREFRAGGRRVLFSVHKPWQVILTEITEIIQCSLPKIYWLQTNTNLFIYGMWLSVLRAPCYWQANRLWTRKTTQTSIKLGMKLHNPTSSHCILNKRIKLLLVLSCFFKFYTRPRCLFVHISAFLLRE